jgi:hypothetical protein
MFIATQQSTNMCEQSRRRPAADSRWCGPRRMAAAADSDNHIVVAVFVEPNIFVRRQAAPGA